MLDLATRCVDEAFGERVPVQAVAASIARLAPRDGEAPVRLMHVCGSHEHSLVSGGLRALLPPTVELIAGPGCPVCVCPEHEIREALTLARRGVLLTTYGDMLRVPTAEGSLLEAAADGAAVRMVYSAADAVRLAREQPEREVCFFAVGFETTAAPTAALLAGDLPANFSILCAHRLTPPAMQILLRSGEIKVDGLIAPGHVSTIVGAAAWASFPTEFGLPTVIAGFESADVMLGVREALAQLRAGEPKLANVYGRIVRERGNQRAAALLEAAFEVVPAWWRGLGELPGSGLAIRAEHAAHDARLRFGLRLQPDERELPKGCACNQVMLGQINPPDCPLFARACHPASPHGPCMVSQEATCYLWHQYGAPAEYVAPDLVTLVVAEA